MYHKNRRKALRNLPHKFKGGIRYETNSGNRNGADIDPELLWRRIGRGKRRGPRQARRETSSQEERLQVLVEKGIISQETLEAILAYLEANPSEAPGAKRNSPRKSPTASSPETTATSQPPPQAAPPATHPKCPKASSRIPWACCFPRTCWISC